MTGTGIDLKREQQASLNRPRYGYSLAARLFFFPMDLLAGKQVTLSKAKLLEMLACTPYRSWEFRQYARMSSRYKDREIVRAAGPILAWSREAQDNEFWHLLVIQERMREEGAKDAWFLFPVLPFLMVAGYRLMTWTMARLAIRRAFLFNAEFEDHAEHEYARFVEEHPEWESQPVKSALVKEYGDFANWAEVFRRIGLDERDHRNSSFVFCGRPDAVARYDGMPPVHDPRG